MSRYVQYPNAAYRTWDVPMFPISFKMFGEEGVDGPFFAFVSGAPDTGGFYTYEEATMNSYGVWAVLEGGRTSTNSLGAFELSGLEADFPNDTLVMMYPIATELEMAGYVFQAVCPQIDSTFVHRTTISGTPTLGKRFDLTFTGTEIDKDSVSMGGHDITTDYNSTYCGWVATQMLGIGYDHSSLGDKTLYAYYVDIEYDVYGHEVSRSDPLQASVDAAEPCLE